MSNEKQQAEEMMRPKRISTVDPSMRPKRTNIVHVPVPHLQIDQYINVEDEDEEQKQMEAEQKAFVEQYRTPTEKDFFCIEQANQLSPMILSQYLFLYAIPLNGKVAIPAGWNLTRNQNSGSKVDLYNKKSIQITTGDLLVEGKMLYLLSISIILKKTMREN